MTIYHLIGALGFVIVVCLMFLFDLITIEERYGATPWPERRLRLFGCITLAKWDV